MRTIGALALVASDEETLQRTIVDPLLAGYAAGTERISVPDPEKPIAKAVILHAWSLARTSWSKTMAAATPPPTPVGTIPTSTTGTSASADQKVPRTLPPENPTVPSPGAHCTLLQLGELLQHRSFSASGEINPLARSPKKANVLSLDEGKQIMESDDPTWTPRSFIGVLDGIQAAKWAYILAQMGDESDEKDICDFIESGQE